MGIFQATFFRDVCGKSLTRNSDQCFLHVSNRSREGDGLTLKRAGARKIRSPEAAPASPLIFPPKRLVDHEEEISSPSL
jgi:hypothetical protein